MKRLWVASLFVMGLGTVLMPGGEAATSETVATATVGTNNSATSSLPATVVPTYREGKGGKFPARHKEILQRIQDGPIDLVFIGDSITDQWSAKAPRVWETYFGKWNAANFGIGGDRTQNVLWRLNNGELEGISPKVIVLMIGTNNTHSDSPEDIVTGIKTIISTIHKKLPETKVLLLGVFPREPRMRNGKPYAKPMEKIRVINRELPKLAEEGRVRYLDISSAFLVDGKVPKSTMPDGVHLTEQGYEMWAKAVAPVIEEMMK